jgi:O-antigen ligase
MIDTTSGWSARLPAVATAALFWIVAVLTLTTPGLLGSVTPFALGAVWILTFAVTIVSGLLFAAYRSTVARMFLIAWLALLTVFAITAEQIHDLIYALNFSPFLFLGPVGLALDRQAAPRMASIVAGLSWLGAAIICIVAASNLVLAGSDRGSGGAFPVIVMSNTAVLLGFIAIGGIWSSRSNWRWLLLAGPLFGVGAALLTGSRGPLIGVIPLALLAAGFLVTQLKLRLPAILGLAGLMLSAVIAVILIVPGRVAALSGIVLDLVSGRDVADYTTSIRLALYEAGYRAFLDAPVFGHGWARLMSSAMPYVAPEHQAFASHLPQLHNDIIDFAVTAGVAGIAIYFLILATPAFAAIRSARDSQYGFRLYAALVLGIGYLFAGLTDIMIGFDFHTMLFASISVLVLGVCRDRSATT